jgi:ABC-type transport system substrate-binding protein
MAREVYEQDGHMRDRPIGTGPFMLDQAAGQKGTRQVLKRNPNYFEAGKPYLDEYQLVVIKDESLRQAAFKARQIDIYEGGRDPSVTDEVRRAVPGAQGIDFPSSPMIVALNFKRPPFDDLRARLAFSRAIDRDEVVRVVTKGSGGWAPAFSNVRDDLFSQEEIKTFVKYDPDEAKRLLNEAGYAQGFQAEVIFSADGDDALQKAAELVQAQLKRVNINLVLKPLEVTEMTRRRRAADCDLCWLSEAARVDPDGQLFNGARARGTANYNQIADPRVEEMVLAQRREPDPEKRRQLLKQVVRHINEQGFAVATWRSYLTALMQPQVRGYYQHSDYREQGVVREAWLAQ